MSNVSISRLSNNSPVVSASCHLLYGSELTPDKHLGALPRVIHERIGWQPSQWFQTENPKGLALPLLLLVVLVSKQSGGWEIVSEIEVPR
jgi:hypothetical protein